MDKKGFFGLLACGIALAFHFHYSSKLSVSSQNERRREPVKKELVSVNAPKILQVKQKSRVAEKLYVIESPLAKFTFTNLGGGLKSVDFKGSLEGDLPLANQKLVFAPLLSLIHRDSKEIIQSKIWSSKEREIIFLSNLGQGLLLKQRYALPKEKTNDYTLDVEFTLENNSSHSINLSKYQVSLGAVAPLGHREFSRDCGFFLRSVENFEFYPTHHLRSGFFRKGKDGERIENAETRYFGLMSQYFAVILDSDDLQKVKARTFLAPVSSENYLDGKSRDGLLAYLQFPQNLDSKQQKHFRYRLFVGPKERNLLANEKWEEVMNYGWFGFVSSPLNQMLNFFHSIFANFSQSGWIWGVSLILLTIFIRFLLWPFHHISMKAMKKISFVQPHLQELRKKHSDNPQKLNQEMMRLYREYGVNPAAGCLPIFFQIPIFFGFYRMLQYASELRHQDFLWVADLSQPDTVFHLPALNFPVNIMPLLMAITMVWQMKIMPATGDAMQRKIMLWLMPFLFLVFCYNFASALALYWTVQNLFSIVQTKLTQVDIPEPQRQVGRKGFFQRIAEQQKELKRTQGKRVK